MTLKSAAAKFEELASNIQPTSEPEKWSLYAGLGDFARSLDRRLDEIERKLTRLEHR